LRKTCSIVALLIAALSSVVLGQTKVGTLGGFYSFPPSARGIGMGNVGASLVDNYSFYYNPAALAFLFPEKHAQLGLMPSRTDFLAEGYKMRFGYYAFTACIIDYQVGPQSHFYLNVGYYLTRMKEIMRFTSYEHPQGDDESEIEDNSHNIMLAFGRTGMLDIGCGITMKANDNQSSEKALNFYGIDLGVLVRISPGRLSSSLNREGTERWYVSPAAGFSTTDTKDMANNFASTQWGLSAEFGYQHRTARRYYTLLAIVPALDMVRPIIEDKPVRYGAEVSFFEALSFRIGRVEPNGPGDYDKTWGFGLKSRGLARFATELLFPAWAHSHKGLRRVVCEKLQVEFDFAQRTYVNYLPLSAKRNLRFYGVTISL
jgi:hypothetical protein